MSVRKAAIVLFFLTFVNADVKKLVKLVKKLRIENSLTSVMF